MGTYYAVQGGSRILNASRVDQSGSDNAAVIEWLKENAFILAVNINSNGKDSVSAQYKLRWRISGGSFVDVASTGAIKFGATDLSNGTGIAVGGRKCDSQGGDTWQTGYEVEGTALSTAIDLADEYETEVHFSLSCADAGYTSLYEFELYDATAGASRGTCGATLTTGAAPADELVAQDITTPVPTITTSVIGQVHVLVDQDVITPVPTITNSVIGQIHVLVDQDIQTPVPTISKPTLAEAGSEDALTAQDVTTPVPTVTTSVIGQVHILTDQDITTPVPTITQSVIGQVHVLVDQDISTPVPTVTQSSLGQIHVLTDQDITTPVPTVEKPTLAEITPDVLVSKDITTPVPTISKPTLAEIAVVITATGGAYYRNIIRDRNFRKRDEEEVIMMVENTW